MHTMTRSRSQFKHTDVETARLPPPEICLKICDSERLHTHPVLFDDMTALWKTLRSCTVEAAQFPADSLVMFLEHCFYFATIEFQESKDDDNGFIPWDVPWDAAGSDNQLSSYASTESSATVEKQESRIQPSTFSTGEHSLPNPISPFYPSNYLNFINRNFIARATDKSCILGFIYMTSPQLDVISPGEINLGIILKDRHQGQNFGPKAALKALQWAFESAHFHRIQAVLIDQPTKLNALSMLFRLGFVHEGTRRRSVLDPKDNVWKDTTYLAILDTDWTMRTLRKMPKTPWDELFVRQAKEREELLMLDGKRLKRSASNETIRRSQGIPIGILGAHLGESITPQSAEEITEDELDIIPRKRRYTESGNSSSAYDDDSSSSFCSSFEDSPIRNASSLPPPSPSSSLFVDGHADGQLFNTYFSENSFSSERNLSRSSPFFTVDSDLSDSDSQWSKIEAYPSSSQDPWNQRANSRDTS